MASSWASGLATGPVCGGAAGSCTVTRGASGPWGEGEGAVVCLGDALDDCQAEADTCVVGAYALGAAKKRLGKRGDYLWGETSRRCSRR